MNITFHTFSRIPRVWFSYLLLTLVALILRVAHLGEFVTIDEVKFWIPRSDQFLTAMHAGNYNAIPVVGHPGVTTMWLGSAGIWLRRLLFEHGILHTETYPLLLTLYRLPTALLHTLGIVMGYALLRRIVAPTVALLAALLWATDPFVLAYSRVLHVDALAGTFATLSLLCAVIAFRQQPPNTTSWRWVALSAITGGLAVLSKLPALALVPAVGSIALYNSVRVRHLSPLLNALVWGGVLILTLIAVWPLCWVHPERVFAAFRYGIESEGGQPHMWGNFFMGQPVNIPGYTFYPVALALRMTPWALVGVLLLPWATRSILRVQLLNHHNMMVWVVFIVVFVVGMSLFPKKMNRYMVLIFPLLDVLAALGIVWASRAFARAIQPRLPLTTWHKWQKMVPFVPTCVAVVACVNAAVYHPYAITYANQLFGGARQGARVFLTGWGEGFRHVADWLNAQPDITSVVTVTSLRSVLQPYLCAGAYATSEEHGMLPDRAGYIVAYISDVQRVLSAPYSNVYGNIPPLHTIVLHDIPYAWVYHAPPTIDVLLQATFDARTGDNHQHDATSLRVTGYAIDDTHVAASGMLTLTMQWLPTARLPHDYNLFVHVFDAQGQRVGQLDVPLLDPHAPNATDALHPATTTAWQAGRYVTWVHPVPVQADIAEQAYVLGVGVYNPQTLARLPLQHTPINTPSTSHIPDDGEHVLLLSAH